MVTFNWESIPFFITNSDSETHDYYHSIVSVLLNTSNPKSILSDRHATWLLESVHLFYWHQFFVTCKNNKVTSDDHLFLGLSKIWSVRLDTGLRILISYVTNIYGCFYGWEGLDNIENIK